jgi:hypothetical protein
MLRIAALVAATGMLASCADDVQKEYADRLVDRFDVPGCDGARMVRAGRNPDESKPGSKSVYVVEEHCLEEMRSALALIGFDKTGDRAYRYSGDRGWYELVELTVADDQQQAGIIWETVEP